LALTPQNPEAFLREVDDELRRDQMASAWQRYGRIIVVIVVAALAALGGYLWWQHQQRVTAGTAGETMVQTLKDLGNPGKAAEVDKQLGALATGKNEGYAALARLTIAAKAVNEGDTKKAVAEYGRIAGDQGVAEPFRNLALIRQTAAEFDTLPPDQVVTRLKPLAAAGNPWFGSAGEMVAMAYLKQGKADLALPIFKAMAEDEGVPQSIRARAARIASALTAK
jgi:hypothetical protein